MTAETLELPLLFDLVDEAGGITRAITAHVQEAMGTVDAGPVTASRIMAQLLRRHRPPEWASFSEMRCAGWGDPTRIDLFTVNTWAAQKLRSVAYEIKISRSDFRRELTKPWKRELAERVATECYFVAPARLIKPAELPAGWGLVELWDYGLRMKARAPRREPEPWPLPFIAMLARRAPEGKTLDDREGEEHGFD